MTHRVVLTHPNKELRKTSQGFSVEEMRSTETQQLIDDMMQTMKEEHGVGLAAPQVGVHKRLIVCDTKRGIEAFLNPEIVKVSTRMVQSEEGCLSIPKVYGVVERHKNVKVVAYNRHGEKVQVKTGGLLAVIFQHEIDHLDGVLFIDRAHTVHDISHETEGALI